VRGGQRAGFAASRSGDPTHAAKAGLEGAHGETRGRDGAEQRAMPCMAIIRLMYMHCPNFSLASVRAWFGMSMVVRLSSGLHLDYAWVHGVVWVVDDQWFDPDWNDPEMGKTRQWSRRWRGVGNLTGSGARQHCHPRETGARIEVEEEARLLD